MSSSGGAVASAHPRSGLRRLLFKRLLRSLWRVRLRVVMILLLLIIATFTSVMMAEFNRNADTIYHDFYELTNLADLVVETGDWVVPRANLSAACRDLAADRAGNDLEVNACETRLVLDGQYLKMNGEWIHATFYGMEAGRGDISRLYLVAGGSSTLPGQTLLDDHVHTEQGTGLGDTVTVRLAGNETTFQVVGLVNSPHHLFYVGDTNTLLPQAGSYAVLYLPVEELTRLAGLASDSRNQLLVDVEGTPAYDLQDTPGDEGKTLRPLKVELASSLRHRNVTSFQVLDRGGIYSVELLRQDLAGSRKTLPLITGLLVGVSGLVIAISLDRLIRSQAREVGVLRALGLSAAEVRDSYLAAPLLLGVLGATLGLLLGLRGSTTMTRWYFGMWGLPVVVTHHYPDLLLGFWLLVVALTLLFGLRPALKASRLMPLEVLGRQGRSRPRPWLVRLTTSLPVTLGLGLRSTLRKPGRLMLTVTALGLSLMVVGGSLLMFASMQDSLRAGLSEAETWDAQVAFRPEQRLDLADWSAAHPEVTTQWYLLVEGNASGDERHFSVHGLDDLSTDGDHSMHPSRLVEGRLPHAGAVPVEVLIDEGTADLLEWQVGERPWVVLAGHRVRVTVVGIGQELGRSLWLFRSDLNAQLDDDDAANGLYIRGLEPDTPAADDLEELAFVIYHDDLVKGFDAAWEKQSAGMATFLVAGGLIAVAVLVNTLLINLSERDAELATLRVLGASRRGLTYILLVEHALIGLAGGLAGAIASLVTAHWFTAAFTNWSFYFTIQVQWSLVVALVLFILTAALATTLVGVWRLGRMDLLEKVKQFGE